MRLPDYDSGPISVVHNDGAALTLEVKNETQYWRRVAFIVIKSIGTQTVVISIRPSKDQNPLWMQENYFTTAQDPQLTTFTAGNTVSATATGVCMNMTKTPQTIIWWPPGHSIFLTFPSLLGGGATESYRILAWIIEHSVYPDWYNNIMEVG